MQGSIRSGSSGILLETDHHQGRSGVEFENLSVKQLTMLQHFIDYFAFDEARSGNREGWSNTSRKAGGLKKHTPLKAAVGH